jgi:hypothetical protein
MSQSLRPPHLPEFAFNAVNQRQKQPRVMANR